MIRLGLIGTESTHVDQFVRHLLTESRSPTVRVAAALTGTSERDAWLAASGVQIAAEEAELHALCDAILITTRDGDRHAELATRSLQAGLATLVDKPLATDPDDAERLLGLARSRGLVLWSASALQFHPLVTAARRARPRIVEVSAPAQPSCPDAGIFFYGVHAAEAACAIALGRGPGRPQQIEVQHRPGEVLITALLSGTQLRVRLLDGPPGSQEFSLADGDTRPGGRQELRLGSDYLASVTTSMLAALDQTSPADLERQLLPALAAVDLLAAAR